MKNQNFYRKAQYSVFSCQNMISFFIFNEIQIYKRYTKHNKYCSVFGEIEIFHLKVHVQAHLFFLIEGFVFFSFFCNSERNIK